MMHGPINIRGISLLAEEILTSQEGLHCKIRVSIGGGNVKDSVAARAAKQLRFGACHTAERRSDALLSIYRLFYMGPPPMSP